MLHDAYSFAIHGHEAWLARCDLVEHWSGLPADKTSDKSHAHVRPSPPTQCYQRHFGSSRGISHILSSKGSIDVRDGTQVVRGLESPLQIVLTDV
jgi:hypothetical protein